MKLNLITFATPGFLPQAQSLARSALEAGFNDAKIFGLSDLQGSDFAVRNSAILHQKRGSGYWLWKPFIIQEQITKLQSDEIIFYCDAGRNSYYQFDSFPSNLVDHVIKGTEGFLLGPAVSHYGNIKTWTKRDCLKIMDADNNEMCEKPQISATWSLWRHTESALRFLNAWLEFAEDARCLTDIPNVLGDPNYTEFRDHRHDQSIVSILAHKRHAPHIDLTNTLIHKLINMRPNSELGQMFYKRPQNIEDVLAGASPLILVREFYRLKAMN